MTLEQLYMTSDKYTFPINYFSPSEDKIPS